MSDDTITPIPVVLLETTEVLYLPPDTMVRWPVDGRVREKTRLNGFGERPLKTDGDPFALPDGRLARFLGWKDEAVMLRRAIEDTRVILAAQENVANTESGAATSDPERDSSIGLAAQATARRLVCAAIKAVLPKVTA